MSPAAGPDAAGSCESFLAALPIQHAAISTLGPPFEVETVCSSDAVAARIDEIQLDLGEGPSWHARQTRAPVVVHDLRADDLAEWPMYRAAISEHPVRSVYAFPLSVGTLDVGSVALFGTEPDALGADGLEHAALLADVAAGRVLDRALAHMDDQMQEGPYSRRVVHQATGMVIAQMRVSAEEALLLIRAHAFTMNRSVRDVAADITSRRIDFSA